MSLNMSAQSASSSSSSSSGGGVPTALRFDGSAERFVVWRNMFDAYLHTAGLQAVLAASTVKLESNAGAELLRVEADRAFRVYSYLMQAIPHALQVLVQHVPMGDARGVWDALKEKFARKTTAKKGHVWGMLLGINVTGL
jgi:hypothetical protein